jgi:hypothetical protein
LHEGHKRGRKNFTVAKLLVEQQERRNSVGIVRGIGGHGIGRDTHSGPSHTIGFDHDHEAGYSHKDEDEVNRWMNMTPGPGPTHNASPGLMMNGWTHSSNHSGHQTRAEQLHGQTLSPATAPGGSMKSPMTIGFPALDDIITLDHVQHLISLFFVHVRPFMVSSSAVG